MKSNTYIPGDGVYYAFDVRAKLLFTLLSTILLFFPIAPALVHILSLLVILFSIAQVGLKQSWRIFSLLLPMLVFMLLFLPLQERDGKALLKAGSLILVTAEAFSSFSLFSCRFIFISYIFSLFLMTSRSKEILPAFRFYHLPYNASLILSLSLRFIPDIGASYHQIRESQRLRLPDPEDERAKKHKFRSLLPTLTSTLVVVLKGIPYTAAALEMRGYGRSNMRTSFHTLPPAKEKLIHFVIAIAIPAILLLAGLWLTAPPHMG